MNRQRWWKLLSAALQIVGIILCGVNAAQASMHPIAGDPVVTTGGKVSGTLLDSGVKAYLGIPYAKAPVQKLRWMPPQRAHWDGIWKYRFSITLVKRSEFLDSLFIFQFIGKGGDFPFLWRKRSR